jgi:hypothetical protein
MMQSSEVRAHLDHPVIDADGHVQEYLPAAFPASPDDVVALADGRFGMPCTPERVWSATNAATQTEPT